MMCWVIEALQPVGCETAVLIPVWRDMAFTFYAHEIPLIGSEGILLGASLKGARKCRSGRTINETVNGNQIWKVLFSCESQQKHTGVVAPWIICMIIQVRHDWINNQMDVNDTCKYLKWKLSVWMSLQLCITPPLLPCATMWLTDVHVYPQAAGLLGWPCFHIFCSNISTSTGWTGTKQTAKTNSRFNAVKWNPVQSMWQKPSWPLGAVPRRTAPKQETVVGKVLLLCTDIISINATTACRKSVRNVHPGFK